MSQASRILELLKNGDVSCAALAQEKLYHHASQRIGELNRKGYQIEFIKGETWDKGKYRLIGDYNSPNSNGKADSSPDTLFTLPDYDAAEELKKEIDYFKIYGGAQ